MAAPYSTSGGAHEAFEAARALRAHSRSLLSRGESGYRHRGAANHDWQPFVIVVVGSQRTKDLLCQLHTKVLGNQLAESVNVFLSGQISPGDFPAALLDYFNGVREIGVCADQHRAVVLAFAGSYHHVHCDHNIAFLLTMCAIVIGLNAAYQACLLKEPLRGILRHPWKYLGVLRQRLHRFFVV